MRDRSLSASRPLPTPAAIAAMFLMVVVGFVLGFALVILFMAGGAS